MRFKEIDTWGNTFDRIRGANLFGIPGDTMPDLAAKALAQQCLDFAAFAPNARPMNLENTKDNIVSALLSYANSIEGGCANSQRGIMLRQLCEKSPGAAAIEICSRRNSRINPNAIPDMRAFLTAWAEWSNQANTLQAQVDANEFSIDEMIRTWDAKLNAFFHNTAATHTHLEQTAKDILEETKTINADAEQDRLNNSQEMTALRRAFSTDMKLRSAEHYWRDKRKRHEIIRDGALKSIKWQFSIGTASLFLIYWAVTVYAPNAEEFSTFHALAYGLPP